MNYNKFFDKAKELGLEALELHISKSKKFSFSLFKNEIDSYSIADSFEISAKGIYQGKMGHAYSEKLDSSTPEFICTKIIENAKIITSDDKRFIFKGSEKYKKGSVYSKKLDEVSTEQKIAKVKALDKLVKDLDSRIDEVETMYKEFDEEFILLNSYGLNLKSKSHYAYVYTGATAKDEQGETKTGGDIKIFSDLDELDNEKLARSAVKKTIDQFGSAPCKSAKYKCVLNQESFADLLSFFLKSMSAEEIQKDSSLLKGKLNTQIASSKLTITEEPLSKNIFFRYFDDEGVATSNKTLIKKGVLQTYLYDLKSAAKDNVQSTGNAFNGDIALNTVKVKPGKLSEEELFQKVQDGIYITSLGGLHAGMNAKSGNFSLQSSGFMIRDGKLAEPVTLITVAGNLFEMFNNIKAVGNNIEMQTSSYFTPSVYVGKIAVSGK